MCVYHHGISSAYRAYTAAAVMLILALWSSAFANGCINCHKDPIFRLHNHKLYMYYQDWITSPHNEAGITCNECHGGNPKTTDKEAAHRGVLNPADSKSTVFFKNQPETCGKCHAEVSKQFTKSKHYKAVNQFQAAPNCTTCHRAMNKKPYYHSIVDSTCKTCHSEPEEKYRSELAEEILRRLNISKGFMGWASLYYNSKNWPGNSKQQLEDFRTRYHYILTKGHNFDLLNSDRKSAELLADLKQLYKGATEECQKNEECNQFEPTISPNHKIQK